MAEAKLGVVDPSWRRPVEGNKTAIGFDVEVDDVVGFKVVVFVEVVEVVEEVEVDFVVVANVIVVGGVVSLFMVVVALVLGLVVPAVVLVTMVVGLCTGRTLDSGQFAGTMPMRPAAMSKIISLWRIQEAPRTVSAPAPSSSKA